MSTEQVELTSNGIGIRALRLRAYIQQQLLHSKSDSGIERLVAHYFNYWQQRNNTREVREIWEQLADRAPWKDFHDVD